MVVVTLLAAICIGFLQVFLDETILSKQNMSSFSARLIRIGISLLLVLALAFIFKFVQFVLALFLSIRKTKKARGRYCKWVLSLKQLRFHTAVVAEEKTERTGTVLSYFDKVGHEKIPMSVELETAPILHGIHNGDTLLVFHGVDKNGKTVSFLMKTDEPFRKALKIPAEQQKTKQRHFILPRTGYPHENVIGVNGSEKLLSQEDKEKLSQIKKGLPQFQSLRPALFLYEEKHEGRMLRKMKLLLWSEDGEDGYQEVEVKQYYNGRCDFSYGDVGYLAKDIKGLTYFFPGDKINFIEY